MGCRQKYFLPVCKTALANKDTAGCMPKGAGKNAYCDAHPMALPCSEALRTLTYLVLTSEVSELGLNFRVKLLAMF